MLAQIEELIAKVEAFQSADSKEIEAFRIEYLGKKGKLNDLFAAFKSVAPEERKAVGQAINRLKQTATL